MEKYLELCVELKKSHVAKEGLYQYKNICQQVSFDGELEVFVCVQKDAKKILLICWTLLCGLKFPGFVQVLEILFRAWKVLEF